MNNQEWQRVPRPATIGRSPSFASQVRDTLTAGDAVAVPTNGETYAVVCARKSPTAYRAARKSGAVVRSAISDDGLSVLFWLEPKDSK